MWFLFLGRCVFLNSSFYSSFDSEQPDPPRMVEMSAHHIVFEWDKRACDDSFVLQLEDPNSVSSRVLPLLLLSIIVIDDCWHGDCRAAKIHVRVTCVCLALTFGQSLVVYSGPRISHRIHRPRYPLLMQGTSTPSTRSRSVPLKPFHSSILTITVNILPFTLYFGSSVLHTGTIQVPYYPLTLSHFSPAPVTTDRAVRIQ